MKGQKSLLKSEYVKELESMSHRNLINLYNSQMSRGSILTSSTIEEIERRMDIINKTINLDELQTLKETVALDKLTIDSTPPAIITPLPHRWYTPIMRFLLGVKRWGRG